MKEKRTNNGRLFFGIAFIIIGLMFLYAKLDIDILGVWRDAVLSVPMIFAHIMMIAMGRIEANTSETISKAQKS